MNRAADNLVLLQLQSPDNPIDTLGGQVEQVVVQRIRRSTMAEDRA